MASVIAVSASIFLNCSATGASNSSAAVFYKDIESYVQRTRLLTTWADMGYSLDLLPTGFSPDTVFNVQSYFNTPGGPLKGYEVSYQQPFSFLPGVWRNFGVQLNYTHVESKIKYMFSSGTGSTIVTTYTENDLLNLSPKLRQTPGRKLKGCW